VESKVDLDWSNGLFPPDEVKQTGWDIKKQLYLDSQPYRGGGTARKQKARSPKVYKRTKLTHKGADGVTRRVYTQGVKQYVKKKSAANGKMQYVLVR
jgi:hypothetical protein